MSKKQENKMPPGINRPLAPPAPPSRKILNVETADYYINLLSTMQEGKEKEAIMALAFMYFRLDVFLAN